VKIEEPEGEGGIGQRIVVVVSLTPTEEDEGSSPKIQV
jgi:hypothetical protein